MLDGRGGSGRSGVGGEYLSVMGGARGAFIAWVDEGGAEDLGAKVQGSDVFFPPRSYPSSDVAKTSKARVPERDTSRGGGGSLCSSLDLGLWGVLASVTISSSGWMVSFVAAVPTTRIPSLAKFLIIRWQLRFYLCPSFPVAIAFLPYLTLLFARVVFIYPQAIR